MKKSYKTWSKGKNAGQPKTQTDSVVQYLVDKLGSTELPSTNKYRKFSSKTPHVFYWVGNHGALRVGKNVSTSTSLTHKLNDILKKE
jgi:hypothetical protein